MSTYRSFEALTEFASVGRRLSFAKAADDLGIAPSALSRRIAALEANLGVRLLHRTTRRVSLTEAGADYLTRAEDILARLDAASAAVSQHAAEPVGRLRFAVPNVFGQRQVAPLLPNFLKRYPRLRLDVSFSDRFEDLLDARLDCAIRIGALEHGGELKTRRLAPIRRLLLAAPTYLASAGKLHAPSDLSAHRILHFQPLMAGQHWHLTRGAEKTSVRVEPTLAVDNAEALRVAAVAGAGVALLATFIAGDDLRAGTLVPVMPDWRTVDSEVSIVFPDAPFTPLPVRALIDFLVERFRGEPPWDCDLPIRLASAE